MQTHLREAHSHRLRVLVVDDDSEVAASVGFLVELLGARVAIALGAATGAKMAKEFKPDLALIDLEMPGADGCQLVKMLHSAGVDCGEPVCVCLTGRHGLKVEQQCRAAGFDGLVRKPLQMDTVESMLNECQRRIDRAHERCH